MAENLRIARLPGEGLEVLDLALMEQYQALQALIRRYLPKVTASVFARPQPLADGTTVEWYSDLAGQPRKLLDLTAAEQSAVKTLLHDRLVSIHELAERLDRIEPDSAALRQPLEQMIRYPGDESVYVVEGQPVLVFWGHRSASAEPESTPPILPAAEFPSAETSLPAVDSPLEDTPPVKRRKPRWLWWLLLLLLLAGLLAFFWDRLPFRQWFAPDYWAMYQAAAGDCEKLKALQSDLTGPTVVLTDALPAVREKLVADVRQCGLPDYWAEYEVARGDCDKLQALLERLQPADVVVTDDLPKVRVLVEQDMLQCRVDYYRQLLAEAGEDCARLKQIASEMAAIATTDNRDLQHIYQSYTDAMGKCRMAELNQQLQEIKDDCEKLLPFSQSLTAEDSQLPGFGVFRITLDEALAKCNAPPTTAGSLRECPGVRPKEIAPELVLVFDASNSMNSPMNVTDEQISGLERAASRGDMKAIAQFMQLMNSGEKRIDVAKRAARSVVSSLPTDVDAGLVLVSQCPVAEKQGFYSGGQRAQLEQRINNIRTVGGTPLASGIRMAGEMIDGVKKPALMVVISDGAESCKDNPCIVAKALAKTRPKLKINVVDIMGTGAANCVAQATGGQVLTAKNAAQFEKMLDTAVEEVKGPRQCGKQ